MKTLRTVTGTKRIEATDKELVLFQIRDILNEQRKALINRLLPDLGSYISYRFNLKADYKQIQFIKGKLDHLKDYTVDLDKYGDLIGQVMAQDHVYIPASSFYNEIDERISWYLNEMPSLLVK